MYNLFIHQIFIECLLYARYSPRLRGDHGEQDAVSIHTGFILPGRQGNSMGHTGAASREIPRQEGSCLMRSGAGKLKRLRRGLPEVDLTLQPVCILTTSPLNASLFSSAEWVLASLHCQD